MKALTEYLYIIVLSLWVGGMSLFTFVLTPVIFKSYSRDEAGGIVGNLFPSYFLFTLAVSVLALILFFTSHDSGSLRYVVSLVLALLAVVTALYVNIGLYPEARKVKQEVHSFENAAPDSPARMRFRRLHARSAVLNLFMIAAGLILLIINVQIRK